MYGYQAKAYPHYHKETSKVLDWQPAQVVEEGLLIGECDWVYPKWPLWLKYNFYRLTIFPMAWLVKKWKRNPQTAKMQMIDILDWFTPGFRWEHGHMEVASGFYKRSFDKVIINTEDIFGVNIIGEKR